MNTVARRTALLAYLTLLLVVAAACFQPGASPSPVSTPGASPTPGGSATAAPSPESSTPPPLPTITHQAGTPDPTVMIPPPIN